MGIILGFIIVLSLGVVCIQLSASKLPPSASALRPFASAHFWLLIIGSCVYLAWMHTEESKSWLCGTPFAGRPYNIPENDIQRVANEIDRVEDSMSVVIWQLGGICDARWPTRIYIVFIIGVFGHYFLKPTPKIEAEHPAGP